MIRALSAMVLSAALVLTVGAGGAQAIQARSWGSFAGRVEWWLMNRIHGPLDHMIFTDGLGNVHSFCWPAGGGVEFDCDPAMPTNVVPIYSAEEEAR